MSKTLWTFYTNVIQMLCMQNDILKCLLMNWISSFDLHNLRVAYFMWWFFIWEHKLLIYLTPKNMVQNAYGDDFIIT